MGEVFYYHELDSTNDEAKRLLRAERSEDGSFCVPSRLYGTVVTARRQTAGHGRLGRSFASPGGDSIYASFILKPPVRPAEQRITAFAAVAVCMAIEKTTFYKPGIKWVNDILLDGKKVCGILAEADARAVILGIGINININEDSLPAGLSEIAGSLSMDKETRSQFFDILTKEVFRCTAVSEATGSKETAEAAALMNEYRARSVLLGMPVVLLRGDEKRNAFCEGIADDGALVVKYDDGSVDELRSSEISVRPV